MKLKPLDSDSGALACPKPNPNAFLEVLGHADGGHVETFEKLSGVKCNRIRSCNCQSSRKC